MCNTNLPTHAINVDNVEVGMRIGSDYGDSGTVKRVTTLGNRRFITFEDRAPQWATRAGTYRWLDAPVGYNYHDGHGCIHDW